MNITSRQNTKIKHIIKLRENKKTRQKDGLMLVEGYDELKFALDAGAIPSSVFTSPELATTTKHIKFPENMHIQAVSRAVFEKISYRENPDGWLGVIKIPRLQLDQIQFSRTPFVLIAESLEKPGNLGAILRTADAARVDAVIVCDPRVDPWNPNTVRASRGALFTVPIVEAEKETVLKWVRSHQMEILASTPSAELEYTQADLRQPIAILVGTEDEGLSEFWLTNADLEVRIPMLGRVNSLNVSIAAALLTYETLRQRGGSAGGHPRT